MQERTRSRWMWGVGALAVALASFAAPRSALAQDQEVTPADTSRVQRGVRGLEGFGADVALPVPEGAATPALAAPSLAARPLGGAPGPLRWALRSLVPTLAQAHGDGGQGWAAGFELRPLAILLTGDAPQVTWLPGDPATLHAGALEVYGGAWHRLERADGQSRGEDAWLAKAGIRGLMPLAREGRALSASLGAGYLRTFDAQGIGYEVGLYGLSGAIGTTFTFSAHTDVRAFLWTFEIRPF